MSLRPSKFRALRHPRQTVRTKDAETIWTFDIITCKVWTIANWPTSELRDKDLRPRVACFGRESKECNHKANLGVLDATDLGIDTRGILHYHANYAFHVRNGAL
jgi:hypothetical protein